MAIESMFGGLPAGLTPVVPPGIGAETQRQEIEQNQSDNYNGQPNH